jgi:hypothetical protein
MSVDTVNDCKIGGKRARLYVYREYDKTRPGIGGGPIAFPWEIYIEEEGSVASGREIRDTDARRVMHENVDRLRKERRKPRLKTTAL